PPATDHCGSCTLCLEACPTDAFPQPYVLDARRCISYLTIEERGEIASELEEKMENLVFGCDICQEVCPWNSEPRPRSEPELAARQENIFPKLSELTSLTAENFAARFPQSPIKRAGFRGFLRNAIIALGNSTPGNGLELLNELSGRDDIQSDPLLRGTLERARGRIMAADNGSDYADGSETEDQPGREDL
ncbi:MAG: 4Fe-4S double cluster binding domain-containing protein, partial [Planctomycetota bacterium]